MLLKNSLETLNMPRHIRKIERMRNHKQTYHLTRLIARSRKQKHIESLLAVGKITRNILMHLLTFREKDDVLKKLRNSRGYLFYPQHVPEENNIFEMDVYQNFGTILKFLEDKKSDEAEEFKFNGFLYHDAMYKLKLLKEDKNEA